LAVGLNCSFGAEQLRPHVSSEQIADTLLLVYPNAGLPNELGEYDEQPETTAGPAASHWAEQGCANVLGGCCGSTPLHIAAIAKASKG
jgi:5-methyltetrahydrofolate--homocysteine methyltransferase